MSNEKVICKELDWVSVLVADPSRYNSTTSHNQRTWDLTLYISVTVKQIVGLVKNYDMPDVIKACDMLSGNQFSILHMVQLQIKGGGVVQGVTKLI